MRDKVRQNGEAMEKFTAATSALTGRPERTIQRAASHGEALADVLPDAVGTSLDSGVELDALARRPAEERRALDTNLSWNPLGLSALIEDVEGFVTADGQQAQAIAILKRSESAEASVLLHRSFAGNHVRRIKHDSPATSEPSAI